MPTQTIEVLRIPGTLFPRGAFDENADYKFLNIVESGGSGYVCLQPCTGIPVTNTAYWFKFCFKGDKGDAFTYADLTAEQKAELVRDATAAAQAAASSAQSAADDAAAVLQKFNAIKAAIDAIDPQSTEGSIQTLAAKQGLLEADLNALGPKIDQITGDEEDVTDGEQIGSKFIYKQGALNSGGSSFSIVKYDISSLSGILSLKSNAADHTSVYCYAIHNEGGTSLSNPSDSQNITVKREFEITLDSLTGYKWLYVAYPVAYVKNTIKGKLEEIDEDIAALQSSVQSVSTEVENAKKATMVMQSKAYADSIKKNLMLNLTYNTFVVASNGGAFFPIKKGQSVEVTADSTTATNYALLDTLPEQVEGTPADYMTGETGHTLAAGETTNFTSPSNGYLYVRYSLWGTASFPSSLKIGTPVADEINSITDTAEKNMLFEPGLTFRLKDLDKIAEGTTTDGIFDDTSRTNYLTSDYIEIDPYVVNPYCVFLETLSSSFKLMEFYDENKGLIKSIMGAGPTGNFADFSRRILKVHFPNGCKYVRYARYKTYTTLGLYKAKVVNMETILGEYESHSVFTENNNILWLGTSIPEGATYPTQASAKCGYNCTNRAHGSSSLCALSAHPTTLTYAIGRRLTMTQAEIEAMFRQDVTNGDITEDKLTEWKNDSYEVRVLPYINGTNATQVSMIVIDHGFNDRYKIHAQMQDVENIDWDSDDRTTFTGAFRFLLDEITKCNPFVKVVIAGYFQNTYMHTDYYADEICRMQELIAEHYSISIMKAWEHSQINNKFVAGTNGYFTAYNAEYGTSISPYAVDSNGNILSMQLYCPDMTHPHSDKTGNCNKRLNAVFSKLLRDLI